MVTHQVVAEAESVVRRASHRVHRQLVVRNVCLWLAVAAVAAAGCAAITVLCLWIAGVL